MLLIFLIRHYLNSLFDIWIIYQLSSIIIYIHLDQLLFILSLPINENLQYLILINQITFMSEIALKHLKQYTSYEFAQVLNGHRIQKTLDLPPFNPNIDCLQKDVKHEIVDRNDDNGEQVLYILRFRKGSSLVSLLFFQLYSEKKYQINMNQKPLFVEIVNQFMYIGGGSQLFIINLQDLTIINSLGLGSDTIHAVEPGYRQFGTQEKGIYIYSWNEKRGYKKRFFSETNSLVSPWWQTFIGYIRPNKQHAGLKNSVLKVVISNVLGVLFVDEKTIYLVDLEKMRIIYNCIIELNWKIKNLQKIIIRYYINQKLQEQGDDSLILAIGQKDKEAIQVLVLSISYKQTVREKIKSMKQESKNSTQIGLPCIASGDMVDWDKSSIHPYVNFYNDSLGLIDFILTQNGILFVYNSGYKLPESGFIDYTSPLVIHPILPLQNNIYSSFFEDFQVYNKICEAKQIRNQELQQLKKLKNSILTPNRYSKKFLQEYLGTNLNQGLKKITKQALNPTKFFLQWFKQHSIRILVKFDRDILLIRQNSVTTFLPIKKQQFLYEYYDRQKIREYYENQHNDENSVSSLQSHHYEDPISIRISNMAPIQQFSLKDVNESCFNYERKHCLDIISSNSMSLKEYEQRKRQFVQKKYKAFWNQFLENIMKSTESEVRNIYEQRNIFIKSHNLLNALLPNRILDMIQFYNRVFKQLFGTTKHIYIEISEDLIKQEKITINYLGFLNNIISKPLEQIEAQGNDLISIFIDQQLAKIRKLVQNQIKESNAGNSLYYSIYNNVDLESWNIFSKLFEGISFDTKQTEINQFINKILDHIKEGWEYLIQILRKPFYPSQIRNVGYFSDEQTNFHYNATTLNIFSVLPFEQAYKMQIITAFVAHLSSRKNSTQILNAVLQNSHYIKLEVKKKIKQIYKELFLNQSEEKDEDSKREMVKLKGLIQLTKIYEGQVLEEELLQESLQDLNRRFRFDQQTYLANYQNRGIVSIKFTIQQLLTSEVFKFRIYVQKLKQFFRLTIDSNSEDMKYQAQQLIKNAIKALKLAQQYYPQLNRKNRKNNKAPNSIDQENFINKVCCSLVGFNDNKELLLYEQDGTGKVLPQLSFLSLLQRIIKDEKGSLLETISKFSSVMNYVVTKFLENPLIQSSLLKIIKKYLDIEELSLMISNSSDLRSQYLLMMNQKDDIKKVREHFPHLKVHGIQLNQISKQVLNGRKTNQLGFFDDDNTALPFRNVYLEGSRK